MPQTGITKLSFRRIATVVVIGSVLAVLSGCSTAPMAKASATPSTHPTPVLTGHLAWGLEQGDSVTVYTSNADGSNAKPLGAAQHGEQPHWSPDGTKLAVVTTAKTGGGIVGSVVNPDGSGQVIFSIPPGDPNLACAVWSPDSAKLACEGFDDSRPDIEGAYVVNSADGTDAVRLTAGPDVPCAYSPDGSQILFIRRDGPDDEHSSLMTVAVGGAHEVRSVTTSKVGLSCDWSPDGKTILSELDGSLLLIDVSSSAITTLKIPVKSGRGAFSPDGTHIVFSRGTGDHQADIWTVRTDGTDLNRITKTPTLSEEFGDWGK